MERIIVSGANGFIGRNLIEKLVKMDYEVIALDKEFNQELELNEKVNCITCNLFDINSIDIHAEDATVFVHLAWAATSGEMRGDYDAQLKNVKMTCDCVKFAANIGCQKFIYASSINEVETYEYLNMNNIEPGKGYIYGAGKLAAHLMGETVAFQERIDFIPILITNIYGAGEKSARLINSSIRKLLKNERCSFTEGNQTYDFIYVDDAINSIVSIIERGKGFNLYYIGSGKPKPLKEFLITMKEIVNPKATIGLGDLPFKGAYVDYSKFEMRKVYEDTHYENAVDFIEGIKLTKEYILEEEKHER